MTRHATPYGAFEIDSMPSQPQIGLVKDFTGNFVSATSTIQPSQRVTGGGA